MQERRPLSQRLKSAALVGVNAAHREYRQKAGVQLGINPLQELFVEWNAECQGITIKESQRRFASSLSRFDRGHSGSSFKNFIASSHDVFRPFFDDVEDELYDSYVFHSRIHFLRMLSYKGYEPGAKAQRMIDGFASGAAVTVLDFGCGLAQISREIAASLKRRGCSVKLVLADIPTERKEFLKWLCLRDSIDMRFLDCTKSDPTPDLPIGIDICVAKEFFEHVRNPIQYFDYFNDKMAPKSWMITNVSDHSPGYMHVTPDLEALRLHIAEAGFEEIGKNSLFQKRG